MLQPINVLDWTTTVVVAGGPSVNVADIRTIGIAKSLGRCAVLAVSDAVYPCWFADWLHSADSRWWAENSAAVRFSGVKSSLEPTPVKAVKVLRNTGVEGFDPRPCCIRTGSNSGYQAVHLAAQMGARRIIVLGLDYSHDGARNHWFGRHGRGMDKHSNVAEWRRIFRDLAEHLSGIGVEILNAGLKSTLTWLPMVELKRELIGGR